MKRKIIFEYAVTTLFLLVILSVCIFIGVAIGRYAAEKEAKKAISESSTYVQAAKQAAPVILSGKIVELEPIVVPIAETLAPVGENFSPTDEAVDVSEYMTVKYTDDDIFCLAAVIYQEAGGDCCSDETRRMIADVVLNRVEDERFPDTIREVLEDAPDGKLQYGTFALTGVQFPEKANLPCEKKSLQRAYDVAYSILAGEHSYIYGSDFVWQAEFEQGYDGFWADNIYFGRG